MVQILTCTDALTESNGYLIAEEGRAVLVDPNDAAQIKRLLLEHALVLDFILLTHEHCDHIRGLEALRAPGEIPVICSRACSRGLTDITQNLSRIMEVYLFYRTKRRVSYPPFVCREADVVYDSCETVSFREHRFVCTSLPGHSPGSSCIVLDGQILFSGDYLLPGQEVVTRLPRGDAKSYETAAKPWLSALPDGLKVYPGHGLPYVWNAAGRAEHGL